MTLAGMLAFSSNARGEPETNTNSAPPPLPVSAQDTNVNIAQETMRSFLFLQEQLHATRLAMERDRQEAAAAAQKNSEAVAARLEAIESALAQQRSTDLEAFKASNRTMLTVACIFGAVGLVGLLFMAWSHWRSIHRLADLAAAMPAGFAMRQGPAIAAIEGGETKLLPMGASEQSGNRLLDALEKLEKRILEMEQGGKLPAAEISGVAGGGANISKSTSTVTSTTTSTVLNAASASGTGEVEHATNGGPHSAEEAAELLKQGQALLDQDQAEQALATFEQAVTMEPGNAEALVKKGAALERLRKSDEALKCYDQAIAANKSLTIAYLYKGGLFNRMERFNEALQCYELALRTQERKAE
jgi:tetratricopeptide (TPR) repeat protein